MNRFLIYVFTVFLFGAVVSCSKDDDGNSGSGEKIEKEDIIGTWTASSGKYDLSFEITSSGYDYLLSESGNGGVRDWGTYQILNDGKIVFTSEQTGVFAMGYMQNGKLSLTFVHSLMISMLGTAAASHTEFMRSDESGEEDYGFLVVQNLSDGNDIVALYFYDSAGELLASDTDVLEAGYQIAYEEVPTGSYTLNAKDDRGKSFTSKSFKVVKNKATVLEYTGSTLNVSATGVNADEYLSR